MRQGGHARWIGEPKRRRTNARQAHNGRRVPRAILRESCGGDVGSRPAVGRRRARGAVGTVPGSDRSVQSEPRRPHLPAVSRRDTVARAAEKGTSEQGAIRRRRGRRDVMVDAIVSHAGWVLFVWVFVNQSGVPVPVVPSLVAAGALAGRGGASCAVVLAATVTA